MTKSSRLASSLNPQQSHRTLIPESGSDFHVSKMLPSQELQTPLSWLCEEATGRDQPSKHIIGRQNAQLAWVDPSGPQVPGPEGWQGLAPGRRHCWSRSRHKRRICVGGDACTQKMRSPPELGFGVRGLSKGRDLGHVSPIGILFRIRPDLLELAPGTGSDGFKIEMRKALKKISLLMMMIDDDEVTFPANLAKRDSPKIS